MSQIDYNLHQPQSINPIPPDEIIKEWEADYNTMLSEMIYGDAPSFSKIMEQLTDLKSKINANEWRSILKTTINQKLYAFTYN